MLKHLRIQNFAIIDQVSIDFGSGLNVISGETGAGKSIIMDALFLIMGGRASAELIRRGADEASVEALFEIDADVELQKKMEELGIPANDGDLIVRRIVHRSGKNRIFLNDMMVNMQSLQSITSQLVDLCSQHDQQLLSKSEEQLLWVDRYGKLENKRAEIKKLFLEWKEKSAHLERISADISQRDQKIDFLRFQIQELEDAEISTPNEDLEIEQELKALSNAENLYAFTAEAEDILHGSEQKESFSLLGGLGALQAKARLLVQADPKLAPALDFLDTIKIHSDELAHFIRAYSQSISHDEDRLEWLNSRSALLTKLKRKYGPGLDDVCKSLERFTTELSQLENHDLSIQMAKEEEEKAKNIFMLEAQKLSKARIKAAKEFSRSVEKELKDLHMERARFEVSFQILDAPLATGIDLAKFQIAANPGEPMGLLNKVASGGELSRIMLAMHNVVSSRAGVGVFLFDEVDAGIGGKTAITVGAKLQKVAANNQVICITHLPQVAVFAEQHFHVEKAVRKRGAEERTECHVISLAKKEREIEIARMLGGMDGDKAAMANAKAMLAKATIAKASYAKAI